MRIQEVKFNTKEKAEKCLQKLGSRGIDIMTIEYKEQFWGYYVHYWTDGKAGRGTY